MSTADRLAVDCLSVELYNKMEKCGWEVNVSTCERSYASGRNTDRRSVVSMFTRVWALVSLMVTEAPLVCLIQTERPDTVGHSAPEPLELL